MGAIRIDRATDLDRRTIYGLRHRVYALELGQHAACPEAELTDSIDARNEYLTASVDDELVGFVSLTPPGGALLDRQVHRARRPSVPNRQRALGSSAADRSRSLAWRTGGRSPDVRRSTTHRVAGWRANRGDRAARDP